MFVGLHADLRIEMFVVVTTFYTLDGMKSILLPKFVFFRSRLRLSLKNTNLLFYCFICFLQGCCTSYYNIPTSLPEGGYCNARAPEKIIVCVWCSPRDVGTKFQTKSHLINRADGLTEPSPVGEGVSRACVADIFPLAEIADDG